jgi:hypothetical protein
MAPLTNRAVSYTQLQYEVNNTVIVECQTEEREKAVAKENLYRVLSLFYIYYSESVLLVRFATK